LGQHKESAGGVTLCGHFVTCAKSLYPNTWTVRSVRH